MVLDIGRFIAKKAPKPVHDVGHPAQNNEWWAYKIEVFMLKHE
jgi:hypothetical protein